MKGKIITLEELTKVEGHARLHVEMDGGKVRKAHLSVYEPSRYFESMVVGKYFHDVPSISQKICGICSVVHTVTSIKAIENAMGIKPSRQTEDLRRLLLYSSCIYNHAAHLFFFAAPDYLGFNDVVEMAGKKRQHLKLALDLQRTASGIVRKIGGRVIHPVTPKVGYFTSVPGRDDIAEMIQEFGKAKKLSMDAARLFLSFKFPELENRSEYLGLKMKGSYPLYDGEIGALYSKGFRQAEYKKNIEEEVISRSTAKYSRFRGKPYMVGALARMNLNHGNLSDSAKSLLKRSGLRMPCFNSFANNIAQAIELVNFADMAIATLEGYEKKGMAEERPKVRPRKGEGVAACEAPRGTLYHHYRFDSSGKATFANIITPTCQNVRNVESDMQKLLPSIIKLPDTTVKRMLEMLIRAYDPCFSCSTHFLDLDLRR